MIMTKIITPFLSEWIANGNFRGPVSESENYSSAEKEKECGH